MTSNTTTTTDKGLFFWLLLGPVSLLGSLSLLILKTPESFPLAPLLLLTGMTLTVGYRLKGLFGSLGLLFLLALYRVVYHDAASLWFLGQAVTVAFSYVITLLTIEEAETTFSDWHSKWFDTHQAKDEAVQKYKEELDAQEKVIELSRTELLSTLTKLEGVQEHFSRLKQEKKKLEEDLEDANQEAQLWQQAADKSEKEKKLEVSKAQELGELIERLEREKDLYENTVSRIQEELEQVQEELTQEKEKVVELPKLETAPEEPPASESEWRRLWGMHRQLREQFEMKCAQLDEARKTLFLVQEEASALKIEIGELEAEESPEMKLLSKELETLYQKIDDQEQEIGKLEALIQDLS